VNTLYPSVKPAPGGWLPVWTPFCWVG